MAAVLILWSSTLSAMAMKPGTAFEELRHLRKAISNAKAVTVLEGPPGIMTVPTPPCDSTAIVALHGYWFFADRTQVSGEEAAAFAKIIGDSRNFAPWGGAKACGGFHPDFCLEYQDGEETHRVLLCFGCHEMNTSGLRQPCCVTSRHLSTRI